MNIELKCGQGYVTCRPPSGWQVTVLEHTKPETLDLHTTLREALANPIGAPPLSDWLRFKRILIIVPDVTRYNAAERFLPLLFEEYLKGLRVEILFALGNHRKQTREEQQGLVSKEVFERAPCFDHDCYDKERLRFLGTTASGLDVTINSALLDADAAIVTGSISFHYLAGFGGGRKAIFPGVAGYDSIIGIHRKVFNPDGPGKHPSARSAILDGNPMHEEIMEALAPIPTPMFLINTVLDDKKRLLNIFAGDMKEAHRSGCDWYRQRFAVTVEKKADVVITSAGGFPKDINFIQAHKSIEHALRGVKAGGTLIVVGACQDGTGNADFLKWFQYGSSDAMEPYVRSSDKVYAQTAYATRLKAEHCRIIFVSELPAGDVETMGLVPAATLDEALALCDGDAARTCYVVPDGSQTLILD